MGVILLKVATFATCLFPVITASLDENLIGAFFSTKSLKFGCIFNCFSRKERVQFGKSLMSTDLRITQNKIEQYSLVFDNRLTQHSHHSGVIVDGDCDKADYLLEQAGNLNLFDYKHHWLITTSNRSFLDTFKKVTLNINADVYVALLATTNGESAQNWTIVDVYNPAQKHGGALKINYIGCYNAEQGFRIANRENKYWLRKNMSEVKLKSMMVLRKPFQGPLLQYLDSDANRRIDSFNRFQYKLIQSCKEIYNFSWEVNLTNSWGYLVSKNKFDGMIGALQRQEIDIGTAGVYIQKERIPVADFSRGVWVHRSAFIFRQPTKRSFSQIFLHPMSTSVWISTLAAGILIIIVLRFIQAGEFEIYGTLTHRMDSTWSSNVLFVLGTFCQQGFPLPSYLLSTRIITVYILLFCLVFYQFYSGSIVSNLLTKPGPKIKNLQDLSDSDLDVGSEDVPYFKSYFCLTNDPTVQKFYQRKFGSKNNSNYFTPKEGLKLVEKGGFAYQVAETSSFPIIEDTFSDEALCELGEVNMFPNSVIMIASQKHSPFRDLLNYCVHRQVEHGIADRQKKHWSPLKPECLQSRRSMKYNVAFKEVYPAVVLLGVGMLTSLIILALEVLLRFWITKTKRNSDRLMPSQSGD